VSTLGDKLRTAANPRRESNIEKWLKSLDDNDRKTVWTALRNPDLKTFTLLNIFREEGARFDKGTFTPFRKAVLAGVITEADVHGA
jgi:hypothetical protein